jgi:molybdate transport system substrate-binding protein
MNRLWLALVFCLAATNCKGPEPEAPPKPATPAAAPVAAPQPAREDKLLVFAAASLREVFTSLGEGFEHGHPGVDVAFNFAGTQELRTQLEHGALADVFASADMRHMDDLVLASRVSGPVIFARNEPVVVVAQESAAKLKTLADLPKAKRIVIGVPDVPIGRYTLQILDRAAAGALGVDFRSKVEAKVVSRELNVRQVLAKVSLGEADAGFVYRTDAQTSLDRVSVVTIPPEVNVIAEYPIAVVSGSAHPELARAWVELVRSAEGQRVLGQAGFLPAAGSDPKL